MRLKGSFAPPGDKSISHRAGLFSLLGHGRMRVSNYSPCQDCSSTLGAVKLLGGEVRFSEDGVLLTGAQGRLRGGVNVDCGNSGTTLRLLMGLLAGVPGSFVLDGDESLRRRPMERVATPLRLMGAQVECLGGRPPVNISGGGLKGIDYTLPVASAQLKSAILLAGVQAGGTTFVGEPVVSRDHSERLLALCGANIRQEPGGWRIERSELTLPEELRVPGDASSAAFFLCAAAIIPGSQVISQGTLLNPTRVGFLRVLERMGAALAIEEQGRVPEEWGRVSAAYSPELKACTVRAEEIPLLVDEVPILALVATQAQGTTVMKEVGELRVKESDRLAAVASQLGAMGADISIQGEDLVINGPTPLKAPAGELDSFGDHRIAMTLSLAGVLCGQEVAIKDAGCAAVSYPGFGHDLGMLLK
ncbi:MAG: 3-phosphoshikimate 1-carboxyvinyltransferase [Desulfarculus sp.]|nr:3-phosphoshikimate 1-carboxyvinyltransferase [Desulfarculus sp.]